MKQDFFRIVVLFLFQLSIKTSMSLLVLADLMTFRIFLNEDIFMERMERCRDGIIADAEII